MGKAYPRRNDGVTYEQFDGKLESVQRIANLTKQSVVVTVQGDNIFYWDDTVTLKRIELGADVVELGDYVVVPVNCEYTVVKEYNLAAEYTRDGN